MDTESILSKLDEITALLELSCRQQQEILSRLDGQSTPAPAEPMDTPMEDIPEIPSIEFPFRPEDLLTCPNCHMMQSSSHDACSRCGVPFFFVRSKAHGRRINKLVASQQKLTIGKQYESQKSSCTPFRAIV